MSGRAALAAPKPTLAPREFRLFQRLIEEEAGIHLVDAKLALVEGRLSRRLRELELDFPAYFALVERDAQERARMLDCISTNETHFFREPRQFELFESRLLPEWQARVERLGLPRRFRVWSAGCSTGEEPCSVAMSFLARFPPGSGFEISVLATDLSTRVLEKAASFVYPLEKSHEVPAAYLKAFMLRGTGPQAARMKVASAVRGVVRYARLNLNGAAFDLRDRFDLVLCRNVLIYFDTAAKQRVVSRLLERLDPEGHLFVGHAETLTGLETRAVSVGPTVYRHAQRTAAT
ncbi:MAG TPA: protein-glutamate O-methyltransferase CheR [Vicinamibacteria bacterium]